MGKKHIHKYHIRLVAGTPVWACALGDCNHYMPDHLKDLVPGKKSICWLCDNVFTLTPENMKDEQPKCFDCRNGVVIKTDTIDVSGINFDNILSDRLKDLAKEIK